MTVTVNRPQRSGDICEHRRTMAYNFITRGQGTHVLFMGAQTRLAGRAGQIRYGPEALIGGVAHASPDGGSAPCCCWPPQAAAHSSPYCWRAAAISPHMRCLPVVVAVVTGCCVALIAAGGALALRGGTLTPWLAPVGPTALLSSVISTYAERASRRNRHTRIPGHPRMWIHRRRRKCARHLGKVRPKRG